MSPPYARASRRLLRRRSPRLYMPGLARRLETLLAPGRNSATSVPDTLLQWFLAEGYEVSRGRSLANTLLFRAASRAGPRIVASSRWRTSTRRSRTTTSTL